ncbi:MAG: TolC family protein, partial [Thermoanaerobaculia bacterium]
MRIVGMFMLLGLSAGAWPAAMHAQVPSDEAAGHVPGTEEAPRYDTVIGLTLDEAVRRALNQSEEIRLARSQLQLAEAQVRITRSQALPQINANLGYTRTFASLFDLGGSGEEVPDTFADLPFGRENAYAATISGSQLLYSGGRVGSALQIARSFREATRLNLVEETAEIELQVRSAYYQALLARAFEEATSAALTQAEAFLERERLRLRAGAASELEVLRAEVE